ncbi:hypothetical protein PHMEG_00024494 [Phytophthora megakarya]|uniref:RWP-RK domain-containing protein n=1 Tax=Phytophthora megakarya TaxID=4795 RepID=A0A225VEI9_9STRA|nr:hypothetical protein PHMEG_00024494 [Phytophthora megakarya]
MTNILVSKPLAPKAKTKTSNKRPVAKDQKRKSRRIFDFDEPFLAQLFHMPQRQAADHLGVAVITIKRCCKRHNFKWPYRANKQKAVQDSYLTAKGLAFKNLPVDSLIEPKDKDDVMEESSECDTDTESIDDDIQTKKDVWESLVMLQKAPVFNTPEMDASKIFM